MGPMYVKLSEPHEATSYHPPSSPPRIPPHSYPMYTGGLVTGVRRKDKLNLIPKNANTQAPPLSTQEYTEVRVSFDVDSSTPTPLSSNIQPDMEQFLFSLHRYWYEGGFFPLVANHLSHLFILVFTVFFACFIYFLNWKEIIFCATEEVCSSVPIFKKGGFRSVSWNLPETIFFLYLCVPSIILIFWHTVCSFYNLNDAWKIKNFLAESLRITTDASLRVHEWTEIVALLIKLQEVAPFCVVQIELTALDIVNTVMRQDNFLIALTNRRLLTSCFPRWIPQRLLYTRTPLWNVRTAIFADMFDKKSRICFDSYQPDERPEPTRFRFLMNLWNFFFRGNETRSMRYRSLASRRLAMRLRLLGILNLFLLFPSFIFVLIFFFFKHAQDFRANRGIPFTRELNSFAFWTFREFNELPHQVERRLSYISHFADEYMKSVWSSPVIERVLSCLKFVIGAILAVFLIPFIFVDEAPLLFLKIGSRNLMWYFIALGLTYSFLKEASQESSKRIRSHHSKLAHEYTLPHQSPLKMYERLMRLVQHTHYLPAHYRFTPPDTVGPSWTTSYYYSSSSQQGLLLDRDVASLHQKVIKNFCSNFYMSKLNLLLDEILGVLLVPFFLFIWLPTSADRICDFISSCSQTTKNLGDYCVFGDLDVAVNGNSFYIPPVDDFSCNTRGWTNGRDIISFSGKLEKSVLTFLLYYRLSPPVDDHSPLWSVLEIEDKLGGLNGMEMQENTTDAKGDEPGTNKGDAYSERLGDSWKKWGYGKAAVDFLQGLANFQKSHLQAHPYLFEELPRDLTAQLDPFLLQNESLSDAIRSQAFRRFTGPPPMSDEKAAAYFYWLEKLYETKSGRIFYPNNYLRLLYQSFFQEPGMG